MGKKRNKMVSVNYYQAAIEIVRQTDCIISLSSNVSELVNNTNEFDVVSLPFKSDEFSVKLIWNKRSTDDPPMPGCEVFFLALKTKYFYNF